MFHTIKNSLTQKILNQISKCIQLYLQGFPKRFRNTKLNKWALQCYVLSINRIYEMNFEFTHTSHFSFWLVYKFNAHGFASLLAVDQQTNKQTIAEAAAFQLIKRFYWAYFYWNLILIFCNFLLIDIVSKVAWTM